jgi:hypothetical protein
VSELAVFAQVGFRHILARDAADHILFLVALAAIYRGRDWKAVLWVISAFTVGHSVTLALAAAGISTAPVRVIEFLIPMTIIATGIETLIWREQVLAGRRARMRPWFAGLFGLIHGAGFAESLRGFLVDGIAVPLLGFNLGIEAGQVVVLLIAAVFLAGLDRALQAAPRVGSEGRAFGLRVVGVSAVVTGVACVWAAERVPW